MKSENRVKPYIMPAHPSIPGSRGRAAENKINIAQGTQGLKIWVYNNALPNTRKNSSFLLEREAGRCMNCCNTWVVPTAGVTEAFERRRMMESAVLPSEDHVEVHCSCGQHSLNSLGKGVAQRTVCIIYEAQGSIPRRCIYLFLKQCIISTTYIT